MKYMITKFKNVFNKSESNVEFTLTWKKIYIIYIRNIKTFRLEISQLKFMVIL